MTRMTQSEEDEGKQSFFHQKEKRLTADASMLSFAQKLTNKVLNYIILLQVCKAKVCCRKYGPPFHYPYPRHHVNTSMDLGKLRTV
jgi:hypothetical protein